MTTERQMKHETGTNGPSPSASADLFSHERSQDYLDRWERIQTHFVDDPRQTVEQADQLVTQTINDLTRTFESERDSLEREWDAGDEVSTEDLRVALQRYRAFFQRLLTQSRGT